MFSGVHAFQFAVFVFRLIPVKIIVDPAFIAGFHIELSWLPFLANLVEGSCTRFRVDFDKVSITA